MSIKLGEIITGEAKRDAMHIAVVPMIAHEVLYPGQRICCTLWNRAKRAETNAIGIVDPFLDHPVPIEAEFWVLMLPNTVTNLRHEWDHSALATPEEEAEETVRIAKLLKFEELK